MGSGLLVGWMVVCGGVREAEVKHPSRGGNPYDQATRRVVISLWFCRGIEYIRSAPILAQLRHQKQFPCFRFHPE